MVRNTLEDWGRPAKALHWIAAIMILLLLGHGWWMTHLVPRGPDRLPHFAGHAALGYDLLAILVLRLLWRLTHRVPALPTDLKPWERAAAHLGHFGLYVLMFASTLTGWAMAGTGRTPFDQDWFGIRIPMFVTDRALHRPLEDTHKYLAYAMVALVLAHILGALRHHFVKRNSVLRRMTVGTKA
jgi:cytochrome b561